MLKKDFKSLEKYKNIVDEGFICQNSFSAKDGMVTDLNPLVVPNTAMTSCLNGTFYI